MTNTNEENTGSTPSTSQKSESKSVVESPKLSMPKVVLTRINVGGLDVKTTVDKNLSASKKRGRPKGAKGIKRLGKPNLSKPLITQKVTSGKVLVTRGRGRPKKDYSLLADMKPRSKITSGINKNITRAALTTKGGKDLLKKTTLLKRSKIAIPLLKKTKSVVKEQETEKPSKLSIIPTKTKTVSPPLKTGKTALPSKSEKVTPTSLKSNKRDAASSKASKTKENIVSPPKPKLLPIKNTDSDSSDDEFLYDELIEELGNSNKNIINVKPAVENTSKTTNITLKPNTGNKPPTIVKGGIVKRTDLPPDLKSIALPSKLLVAVNKRKATSVENEFSGKKASPWPVSISPVKASPVTKKKVNAKPANKQIVTRKFDSIPSSPLPIVKSVSSVGDSTVTCKSSITTVRPKIGPKQTAKVVPLSKPSQDDYMSDEYTEIETLEEAEHLLVKTNLTKNSSSQVVKTNLMKPTSLTSSKDDPNHDLLKILSDETEIPSSQNEEPKQSSSVLTEKAEVHNTNLESKEKNEPDKSTHPEASKTESHSTSCKAENANDETENQTMPLESEIPNTKSETENTHVETENKTTPLESETAITKSDTENVNSQPENDHQETPAGESISISPPVESSIPNIVEGQDIKKIVKEEVFESKEDLVVEEEPPVRTVYDLMNEISLKYPSWNLHIIPETNAFCIAQVTKGRLGLPTLKKCIELDPESYYAKVYIHQYHIKRFDNVYDSEESILALIEEIHSIKA